MLPLPLYGNQDGEDYQRDTSEAPDYTPNDGACCRIKRAARRAGSSRGARRKNSKRGPRSPGGARCVAIAKNRNDRNFGSRSQKC